MTSRRLPAALLAITFTIAVAILLADSYWPSARWWLPARFGGSPSGVWEVVEVVENPEGRPPVILPADGRPRRSFVGTRWVFRGEGLYAHGPGASPHPMARLVDAREIDFANRMQGIWECDGDVLRTCASYQPRLVTFDPFRESGARLVVYRRVP
jgi:hypothetical protein